MRRTCRRTRVDAWPIDRRAQHRQRFAQAPGGDARLMHRSHVARLRRRHRVDERRQPLIEQHEKSGSMVHATMRAQPHELYRSPDSCASRRSISAPIPYT